MIAWLKKLFSPKPMNEQSLLDKIESKRRACINSIGETSSKKVDEVVLLRRQLSDYLTKGALPCRDCGNIPHGMKKRANIYEVGCIAHQGVRWVSKASTPEEAVIKWNKKNI